MRCIAIIPARGGSKGIRRKNMRILGGQPLLGWTIQAALQSKCIDYCWLTTEDLEIAEYGRSLGIQVISRPVDLARDDTPTAPVVLHALDAMGIHSCGKEEIVLLQPTSPLRNSLQIDECIRSAREKHFNCAVSLTEVNHTPYKMFVEEGGKLTPLMGQEYFEMPRQNLPKTWRINGAIYYIHSDVFLKKQRFINSPFYPYFMDEESSVDIDSESDLLYAEYLLRKKL